MKIKKNSKKTQKKLTFEFHHIGFSFKYNTSPITLYVHDLVPSRYTHENQKKLKKNSLLNFIILASFSIIIPATSPLIINSLHLFEYQEILCNEQTCTPWKIFWNCTETKLIYLSAHSSIKDFCARLYFCKIAILHAHLLA